MTRKHFYESFCDFLLHTKCFCGVCHDSTMFPMTTCLNPFSSFSVSLCYIQQILSSDKQNSIDNNASNSQNSKNFLFHLRHCVNCYLIEVFRWFLVSIYNFCLQHSRMYFFLWNRTSRKVSMKYEIIINYIFNCRLCHWNHTKVENLLRNFIIDQMHIHGI